MAPTVVVSYSKQIILNRVEQYEKKWNGHWVLLLRVSTTALQCVKSASFAEHETHRRCEAVPLQSPDAPDIFVATLDLCEDLPTGQTKHGAKNMGKKENHNHLKCLKCQTNGHML